MATHIQDTLDLMEQAGFVDSYSFKYSPRPQTRALDLPGAVDPSEAQGRLERLQALQRRLTLSHHRSRVGKRVEVLVDGESRKGRNELRGRDRHHRLVNLRVGDPDRVRRPEKGEVVEVEVIEATPHSLIGELCASETALKVLSQAG